MHIHTSKEILRELLDEEEEKNKAIKNARTIQRRYTPSPIRSDMITRPKSPQSSKASKEMNIAQFKSSF